MRTPRTVRAKDPRDVATRTPPSARRPGVILFKKRVQFHVTLAVSASGAERSPTDVGEREANDLDRLAASLDALAFLYQAALAERKIV